MVIKNLPLLSSFLRFDRKYSQLGPPLITKAGSAPVNSPSPAPRTPSAGGPRRTPDPSMKAVSSLLKFILVNILAYNNFIRFKKGVIINVEIWLIETHYWPGRKLGNLGNFLFFLKPYRDFLVFEHLSNFNFFIIVICRFLHLEFLLVK